MGGTHSLEYHHLALQFIFQKDKHHSCLSTVQCPPYIHSLLTPFYKFRDKSWAQAIVTTIQTISESVALDQSNSLSKNIELKIDGAALTNRMVDVKEFKNVQDSMRLSHIEEEEATLMCIRRTKSQSLIKNIMNVVFSKQDLEYLHQTISTFEIIMKIIKDNLKKKSTIPGLVLYIFKKEFSKLQKKPNCQLFSALRNFILCFRSFLQIHFKLNTLSCTDSELFYDPAHFENYLTATIWQEISWIEKRPISIPLQTERPIKIKQEFQKTKVLQMGLEYLKTFQLCPQVFTKRMVRFYDLVNEELSHLYQQVDADILNSAYIYILQQSSLDLVRLYKGLVFAKHFWRGGKCGKSEYGSCVFRGCVELALKSKKIETIIPGDVELTSSKFKTNS